MDLEELLIGVVFDSLLTRWSSIVGMWPYTIASTEVGSTVSIALTIVLQQLLVSELSNVCHWIATPNLACWYQGSWLNY